MHLLILRSPLAIIDLMNSVGCPPPILLVLPWALSVYHAYEGERSIKVRANTTVSHPLRHPEDGDQRGGAVRSAAEARDQILLKMRHAVFVGNAQLPLQLFRGDPAASAGHEVQGVEPQFEGCGQYP